MKPDVLLWLDSNRGSYIPQHFAESFADRAASVSGVSDEDWKTLEAGDTPNNEWYWEAWDTVLEGATVTDEKGVKYSVDQCNGDVWLIPHGMVWNEENDFYDWPKAEEGED